MVETITPVVHGGKRSAYRLSVALHTVGAGAAAALLGAVLGSIGVLAGAPWGRWGPVGMTAVAIAYLLREGAGVPIPLPDARRQVPEWWRTFYAPSVAAFLYGVGLGVGFYTHLTFGTFVAVCAGAFAAGHPLFGAAVCAPFGIARALAMLVGRGARGPEDAGRVVGDLERLAATRLPRLVNAVALGSVALAALAQGL